MMALRRASESVMIDKAGNETETFKSKRGVGKGQLALLGKYCPGLGLW